VVRAACLAALCALLAVAPAASAARPQSEPLRAKPGGFLTSPSGERPAAVALGYVRAHPDAFDLDANDIGGLRLTRSYRSRDDVAHLQWEQIYRGIPVFGPGLRANVAADGRLVNVGEGALPDPAVDSIVPKLSALDALLAAARDANAAVAPGRPSPPSGAERTTTFSGGDRASLTLFGGDRLAWRLLLHGGPAHVYDVVVDANTGATLYRVNMVKQVDARVFRNYPGAPVGGTAGLVDLAPWLTSSTTLLGPNVHVYSDDDDDIDGDPTTNPPEGSVQPGDEIPRSAAAPLAWDYPQIIQAGPPSAGQHCPAAGCTWNNFVRPASTLSWTVNRNQAGTQLFYYVNTYHDHLRDAPGIGFNSASGSFEVSDRVQAQVDDGADTDAITAGYPDTDHLANAYVLAVPDGEDLLMQVYLWSNRGFAAGYDLNDVNAADDASIIYHEYTHGMTNRLVTDASGNPAMNGWQPGAMDEGFADWYAFDFLVGQGLETDTAVAGNLTLGQYEHDLHLRSQGIDCPLGAPSLGCPGGGYTYGDFAGICTCGVEVHADGEIWSETLWDLRTRMIAAHGAALGLNRTRALVTDGLRLAPANPTFLQMRNAIVQADAVHGFGDSALIWSVFAARGMGYRATSSGNNDIAPVEDFTLPPAPRPPVIPPPADRTRPKVSKATLTRKRFKVGARSAFKFTLSEIATVTIGIRRVESGRRSHGRCRPASRKLRKRPRCTRTVSAGSLVRINMSAGAHSVSFSGRVRGQALKPGAYKVSLRATDPTGNRSTLATTSFRILRR
jgi:hypothetical protein